MAKPPDRLRAEASAIAEKHARELLRSVDADVSWSDTGALFLGHLCRGRVVQIPDSGEFYWVAHECAPIGIPSALAPEPLPSREEAQADLLAFVRNAIEQWKHGAEKG